jgi:hypothetical protein
MRTSVIVALVPDLMDRSKVAAAGGDRVSFVNRADDLVARVSSSGAELAVLDLGRPGAVEAVAALAVLDPRPTILGFGSHVDRDLLAAARAAGADRVLARSVFFGDLATHLA